MSFTESEVEEAALHWFGELGYATAYGPDLLPDGEWPERNEAKVILDGRLASAMRRLNPELPAAALDDALRKLRHPEGPSLAATNRLLHRLVVDGVPVEFQGPEVDPAISTPSGRTVCPTSVSAGGVS